MCCVGALGALGALLEGWGGRDPPPSYSHPSAHTDTLQAAAAAQGGDAAGPGGGGQARWRLGVKLSCWQHPHPSPKVGTLFLIRRATSCPFHPPTNPPHSQNRQRPFFSSSSSSEDAYLEAWQAQQIKPKSFYEAAAAHRHWFYTVDLQGRLYLEESRVKNLTSCLKDNKVRASIHSPIL